MIRGQPTGAAMPLCWAHAEYLTLVRSRKDGNVFDRPSPVRERYVIGKTGSNIEIWTLAHQPSRVRAGKILRIITASEAVVHWSADDWKTAVDAQTRDSGLGCWFADLPVAQLAAGAGIVFAIRWKDRWEGRDFVVEIER